MGNQYQFQEKNNSLSNLKQVNYIQRNISQVNGCNSSRGEQKVGYHNNMQQIFKQRMLDQYKKVFKTNCRSGNQSLQNNYLNQRRISKQQQQKHNQHLAKQKSLSTNKSLASISAQFQINIINPEEETLYNLTQANQKQSCEQKQPQKSQYIITSNVSSHKNLFDRRSQYIKSEQLDKRSFIASQYTASLTKKGSPKNLQSSSMLTASCNGNSREDLKKESRQTQNGIKNWRKESDIIQIFEQYQSKFENLPSSQRSNGSQYGTQLPSTKFNLFKNKKPKKGPSIITQNQQFLRDNSMFDNVMTQRSKLSLQPISSTNL